MPAHLRHSQLRQQTVDLRLVTTAHRVQVPLAQDALHIATGSDALPTAACSAERGLLQHSTAVTIADARPLDQNSHSRLRLSSHCVFTVSAQSVCRWPPDVCLCRAPAIILVSNQSQYAYASPVLDQPEQGHKPIVDCKDRPCTHLMLDSSGRLERIAARLQRTGPWHKGRRSKAAP